MESSNNWKCKSLNDIVNSVTIGLVKNSREQDPGFDYTYIKMNNIGSDNSFNLFKSAAVNASKGEILKYGLRDNDVLFNTRNSVELVGKSCLYRSWSNAPVLYNNNIARIRFKDEISPAYAAYAFCSPFLKDQLESMKQGTTNVAAIYYKSLKNLKISYPPIPEQQRIVSILDSAFADIERARANAEKNLKNARELFDSYLNKVFTEGGDDWVDAKLADCSTLITKGSSPKWQGISYVESPGVLFVTSENVGSNKMLFNKTKYVENAFNEKNSKSILQKGDVLTNIVGASIGRTAVYDRDDIANINQAVCMIRCEPEKLSNEYLTYLLNSPYLVKILHDNEIDNARANLSLGFFRSLEIPLPSLEEQTRLVSCISEFECIQELMESLYETKLASLDELKQSLLQKAFSGELTKEGEGIAA